MDLTSGIVWEIPSIYSDSLFSHGVTLKLLWLLVLTYIHTYSYIAFHFINPYKPLGFGCETCLQDITDINSYTQNKHTYAFKILNISLYISFMNYIV